MVAVFLASFQGVFLGVAPFACADLRFPSVGTGIWQTSVVMSHLTSSNDNGSPTSPTSRTQLAKARIQREVKERIEETHAGLPVWIRPPKGGTEPYTGFSRSKLYELAGNGLIRSVSIREPGAIKGTRLFNLQSILAYIARCETNAAKAAGVRGGDET